MRCVLLLITTCLLGCAPQPSLPMSPEALRTAPGVVDMTTAGATRPTSRLIHILDWHYVSKERFAVDLELEGDALDAAYAEHLADVEAVQREQLALLEHLIEHEGLRTVYLEALTPENIGAFEDQLVAFLEHRKSAAANEALLTSANRDIVREMKDGVFDRLLATEAQEQYELLRQALEPARTAHREERLILGAAGQLAAEGRLCVMPAEREAAYRGADPIVEDGVKYDEAAIERRESSICQTVLASEKCAVVILGRDHDLSNNVRHGCEYVRVVLRNLPD